MSDEGAPQTTGSMAALAAALSVGGAPGEEELVRRFRPGLVALLRARTRDPQAAAELANDTLLAVIAAAREGRLREPERLAGFVHGIAKNVLASHFRKRKREPSTVALETDCAAPPPTDAHAHERWQLALRAVAELAADDREVLELSLVQGLAPSEIALRLGLTADTVRMRKMRATRRASEIVQGWLRAPSPERRYG